MNWTSGIGIKIIVITLLSSSVAAMAQGTATPKTNCFAATKQASAPQLIWAKNLAESAVGLIADQAGDVYVGSWDQKSHISRYDSKGKLLWTTSFPASERMAPSLITANPNGEIFLQRHSETGLLLSRLLPNGKLENKMPLPNGSFAVDANGGCIVDEFKPKGTDVLTGKEYLSKYSPTGKLEWSVFLQDYKIDLNYMNPNKVMLKLAVDAKGNIYLVQAEVSASGISKGKLSKYQPDGKPSWSKNVTSEIDTIMAMQLDRSGNIYTVGNHGEFGYYVSKFDPSGQNIWTRLDTTKTGDFASGIEVDKFGNTYIRGTNQKSGEFIAKHNENGQLIWRIKPPKVTMLEDLAVYSNDIFISGIVQGKVESLLIKLGSK